MVEIYGDCVLNWDEKVSRRMRGGRVTHDENKLHKAKLLCLQSFRRPSLCTRWFKYDRDDLCGNKSQFVPVIFEPPCIWDIQCFGLLRDVGWLLIIEVSGQRIGPRSKGQSMEFFFDCLTLKADTDALIPKLQWPALNLRHATSHNRKDLDDIFSSSFDTLSVCLSPCMLHRCKGSSESNASAQVSGTNGVILKRCLHQIVHCSLGFNFPRHKAW